MLVRMLLRFRRGITDLSSTASYAALYAAYPN
jgi:hypothetical protein